MRKRIDGWAVNDWRQGDGKRCGRLGRDGAARLGVLLLGLSLAWATVAAPAADVRTIPVANAEDLALVADGRWVIASSMAPAMQPGGSLYAIDATTHAASRLVPVATAAARQAGARAGLDLCDAPLPPAAFAPHGIAVQRLATGGEALFVVNHGGRESVEVFAVSATEGQAPALDWLGCIPLPAGAVGNAVAVTPDFRVHVTAMGLSSDQLTDLGVKNPSAINGAHAASETAAASTKVPADRAAAAARWMGGVLVWSPASGWQGVPNSEVLAPNGLVVADDGRTLYVASWAGGEVIRLVRGRDGDRGNVDAVASAKNEKNEGNARNEKSEEVSRAALALPFLPDNLRWGGDGDVLATGMYGSAAAIGACVMAPGACAEPIPTGVASIAADSFAVECQRDLELSMGTVALPVADDLWVGPVRGEQLWVVAGERQAWDRCDQSR